MSGDGPEPGSPRHWLLYARSDLLLAGMWTDDVLLEPLCFHCQQAVEKALKGVLIQQSIRFPYTHDLKVLVGLIQEAGVQWPSELAPVVRLSIYATAGRYPGSEESVSDGEYGEAIGWAKRVVDWAERWIAGS